MSDAALYLEAAIISQCFFSIVYLSSQNWQQNRWLVVTFAALLLPLFGLLASESQFGFFRSYFLDNPSFIMLTTPTLYFYTLRLVEMKSPTRIELFLAFSPFITYYLFYTQYGIARPNEFFMPDSSLKLAVNFSFVAVFLTTVLYFCLKILWLVLHNQKKYKDEFAEAPYYVTLSWLKWMIIVTLMIQPLVIIRVALAPWLDFSVIPLWIPFSGFLLTTYLISFFAIRQPLLYQPQFSDPQKPDSNSKEVEEEAIKTKKLLSDVEKEELAAQLEQYFLDKSPYLNPKIRMPDLAAAMGVSTNVFSYLINEHYKVNFFSFINERRIQHATELLKDKQHHLYTLETIGKMSGFNSRSTFNTRFKEFMGESPKEFRARN